MPINYNMLQQLSAQQPNALPQGGMGGVIAQGAPQQAPSAPQSSGGEDDIGSGISGLLSGLMGGGGGSGQGSSSEATPVNLPQSGRSDPQLLNNLSGDQIQQNVNPQQVPNNNYQPNQVSNMGNQNYDIFKTEAYQNGKQAWQNAQSAVLTKSPLMAIVDFTQPSSSKRMWVIDNSSNKVVMNTWVTHGAGSGKGPIPNQFSNTPNSHMSSLGTFLTGAQYQGKNGTSMRVQGLDKGFNDKAAERSIVVHPANYIGNGKTGTSWGCFAMTPEATNQFMKTMGQGSVIFSHAPNGPKEFVKNPMSAQSIVQNPQNNPFKPDQINQKTNPNLEGALAGIAHVETGAEQNPYQAMSKPSPNGDRAHGKYQIMGSNIPSWTKEALGKQMSPDEFIKNPAAQEATAGYMVNNYLNKYGNLNDVYSMWFSGRPMSKVSSGVKDAYGTTVPQYVKKANEGFNKWSQRMEGMNRALPTSQNSNSLINQVLPGSKFNPMPNQTFEKQQPNNYIQDSRAGTNLYGQPNKQMALDSSDMPITNGGFKPPKPMGPQLPSKMNQLLQGIGYFA